MVGKVRDGEQGQEALHCKNTDVFMSISKDLGLST